MAEDAAATAADDALEAALRQLCEAAGYTDGLITGYVVVAAQKFWDEDGVGMTSLVFFEKDEQPDHETAGLLRAAQLLIDQRFLRPEDDAS